MLSVAVAEGSVWRRSDCGEYRSVPQADTQSKTPAAHIPPLCLHGTSSRVANTSAQRQGEECHTSVS